MKKLFYAIFLLSLFISCSNNKQKAEILYNSCLTAESVTDYSESEKTLEKLDKAIKLDPKEWKYYFQKIRIYKYRLVKSDNDIEKTININSIISVYDEWVSKHNTIDTSMQFGLGCAYIAAKKEDAGIMLLNDCYNRILNNEILEQEDISFIEGVLSGIIINQIDNDKVSQFAGFEKYKKYEDFLLQEMNLYTSKELAEKYAGGI